MDEDKKKRNVIQLMLGFVRRANGDHVSAYAAQAAYFLIMSFIPFILFLTTLIRYTPLSYNVVRDAIIGFVPGNLQTFVLSIVVEVYKRSTAIVPLSALMALWASGKGMPDVFDRRYTYHFPKKLDIAAMQQAAELLTGTHEFAAYTDKKDETSTKRTIYAIMVGGQGGRINIQYEGTGFLYHMVRILTGTLLEVGMGTRRIESVTIALEAKDRTKVGFLAPARGLFLDEVYYKEKSWKEE